MSWVHWSAWIVEIIILRRRWLRDQDSFGKTKWDPLFRPVVTTGTNHRILTLPHPRNRRVKWPRWLTDNFIGFLSCHTIIHQMQWGYPSRCHRIIQRKLELWLFFYATNLISDHVCDVFWFKYSKLFSSFYECFRLQREYNSKLVIDRYIRMACQPVCGYFLPRS